MTSADIKASRNLWLEFELQARRLKGDEKPPDDAKSVRRDLNAAWEGLGEAFQTAIGPAVSNLYDSQDEFVKAREALESLKDQRAELLGNETSGWRYGSDVDTDDAGFNGYLESQRDLLEAAQAQYSRIDDVITVLELAADAGSVATSRKHLEEVTLPDSKRTIDKLGARVARHRKALGFFEMDRQREVLALGPSWVGGWELGSGTFGKASLWVRQDASGSIVDVRNCARLPLCTAKLTSPSESSSKTPTSVGSTRHCGQTGTSGPNIPRIPPARRSSSTRYSRCTSFEAGSGRKVSSRSGIGM